MKVDIVTIFPNQIAAFLREGVFRIAQEKRAIDIVVHDLRKWTNDKHKTVDDTPFGGGAGMVMKIEPVYRAIGELKKDGTIVIAMTPRGERLNQKTLLKMSSSITHYIILCGHYEGMDERIHENLVDIDISIGDYILSGGELPALVLVDGMVRLIPGVLGNKNSSKEESFTENFLEYPQYTKPADFNGLKVPDILLSGDHKKIKDWRKEMSLKITEERRADLVKKGKI